MKPANRSIVLLTLLLFGMQAVAVPLGHGCAHNDMGSKQGVISADNPHVHHTMPDPMDAGTESESGCDCDGLCATSCGWAGQQSGVLSQWGGRLFHRDETSNPSDIGAVLSAHTPGILRPPIPPVN